MGSSLLTWILGYAAGKTADKLLKSNLEKQLNKTVSEWANSIQQIAYVNPDALFPKVISTNELDNRPELGSLRKQLENEELPSEEKWLLVFMEAWRYVKQCHEKRQREPQPFFRLSEKEAEKHLQTLANMVYRECVKDSKIFNVHVASKLEQIEDKLEGVAKTFDSSSLLQKIVKEYGANKEVVYSKYVPVLDMPQLVKRASKRKKTIGALLETSSKHAWMAINGECGCGKTQLAILLAKETGEQVGWIGLRDARNIKEACIRLDAACSVWSRKTLETNRRCWYSDVCKHFATGSLLVIDDTPRLDGSDELSARLVLLAESCKVNNITLISTSNFQLPTQLMEQIGSDVVTNIDVPPFDDADAKELFAAYGAPENILKDEFISFFNILTHGNATLLAALARYLSMKGWVYLKNEFEGLVTGRYADKINEETLTKFIKTVEDSDSRELLYRLKLITHSFASEDVKAIANVKPQIKRPLEKLHLLLGPWVQQEANDEFTVSPLIKRLKYTDLGSDTARGTCLVLAHRIMSITQRRHINQWEAQQAVMYFCIAKAYQNAAAILLIAMYRMVELEGPFEDAFLSLFWCDSKLPTEIDLGMRICLRGMQICIREKLGNNTTYLVTDLDKLLSKASKKDALYVFMSISSIVTKTDLCQKKPSQIYKLLTLTMKLLPEAQFPNGSKFELPGPFEPEVLIWLSANTIQEEKHLRCWICMLEELSSAQREKAFRLEGVDELSVIVANKLFLIEFNKPEDCQNWDKVLEILEEFAERVATLQLWWLWACVNYTKMIVLAEHIDKFDKAVELGEKVLQKTGDDPKAAFLIQQYIGRRYYYKKLFEKANLWLSRALEQKTNLEMESRLETMLCLSHLVGEKEPEKAIEILKDAVLFAKNQGEKILKYELLKALGELAVAKWITWGADSAFEIWDEACEELFARHTDNIVWKSLFVIYMHTSAYFANISDKNHKTGSSGDANKPFRGMFIGWDFKLEEQYVSNRECYLMVQVSNFAEKLEKDNRAIFWALRAIESAKTTKRLYAIPLVTSAAIVHNVLQDEYSETIDIALHSGHILVASKKLQQAGNPLLDFEYSLEKIIKDESNENLKQADNYACAQSLIPIAFHLLSIFREDEKKAERYAKKVMKKCRQVSKKAIDSVIWEKAAELFNRIFSKNLSGEAVLTLVSEFDSDYYMLSWIAYLGLSIVDGVPLEEICRSQVSVIRFASKIMNPNSVMFRQLVLPFISEFWAKKFKEQRFRFRSPKIVEKSLEEVCEVQKNKRVQAILRAIVGGLSIQVEPDTQKWLGG